MTLIYAAVGILCASLLMAWSRSSIARLDPRWRDVLYPVLACVAVVALSVGFLTFRFQLWEADLGVPFQYVGDSFSNHLMIKSVIDEGWWMKNHYVGAPGGLEFYDYPFNPNLQMAVIKVIALFSSNTAKVMNIYFLLSFPLIALTALAGLRSLNVGYGPAVLGSVLYAFLPYHFWRSETHLWLGAYWMIPLVVMVVVWVARGEPLLVCRGPSGWVRIALSWRTWAAVAVCLMAGLDFVYYPVFAAFFLVFGGVAGASVRRDFLVAGRGILLAGLVAVGLVVNCSPNIAYRLTHGPNPSKSHEAAGRKWFDGEYYALKPVQLLLPAMGHPITSFVNLRNKYYASTPLPSGEDSMALGAVGATGLLIALAAVVWLPPPVDKRALTYQSLGLLIILTLLFGGVGGFGIVMNLLELTSVRCYDRMSIFIAFFAIGAFVMAADDVRRVCSRWRVGGWLSDVTLASLLVLGLCDQSGCTYLAPYATVKAAYANDADFVARVEDSVPKGTMIFQFPYLSFISTDKCRIEHIAIYSHFRGYFHSKSLRWSYGAMHGRETDCLHAALADLPTADCLRGLAVLGFGGVYVDRFGYAHNGREFEDEVRQTLCAEPVVSKDGRFAFYPIQGYADRLRKEHGDPWWRETAENVRATARIALEWNGGFYGEERVDKKRWHWSAPDGDLVIVNNNDQPQQRRVTFSAMPSMPGPCDLEVTGLGVHEVLTVNSVANKFDRVVEIPPGRSVIHFHCTGSVLAEPAGRTLVFAVINLQLY